LPFAVVVVAALPWTPLSLFALIVMPLREMRARQETGGKAKSNPGD